MSINSNPAYSTNFRLEIQNAPEVNYFIQSTELPSLNLPAVPVPYQDNTVYMPGDTLEFSPLVVQFIVDEDYDNYIYLYKWMLATRRGSKDLHFKDLTLHLLSNNKTQNINVCFVNSIPTDLSALSYDNSTTDVPPVLCTVSFRYHYFEFKK